MDLQQKFEGREKSQSQIRDFAFKSVVEYQNHVDDHG